MNLFAAIRISQESFDQSAFIELTESIKEFDTFNHDILVVKLEYYGIRETSNNWFSSYLKNRSQYVSILGFDSDIKPVNHSIPQRSVLGPLLFLIHINDLHTVIKSKIFHFTDDTNLLNIKNSPRKLQKCINVDLKNSLQLIAGE